MARELEVKVVGVDVVQIEEKLKHLKAKLVSREKQINSIYDYEDNSFEDKKQGYIRIRKTVNLLDRSEQSEFTIKKVIDSDGVREYEEIETLVSDPESLELILGELNLRKKHEGYKERTRYSLDGIVYDIDRWDEETLPYPYLEIEVESKEDLARAVEMIGVSKDKISLKSIRELRVEAGLE